VVDAYTTTSSIDTAKTAYDMLVRFALRPQLYFDAVSDVQPTRQSMPGAAVVFTLMNDLAPATSALNESTDVSAVALSDNTVTLTLAEYGNAVITTAALRGESFVEIDPIVANILAYNAGVSIDTIARNILEAGTNVAYSTGTGTTPTARNQVAPNNTIGATDVRAARSFLVKQNVPEVGTGYVGYIHPDIAFDLRSQTGSASWRDPHTYSQPGEIWSGEVGMFEGVRFIETPRAPSFQNAGSSPTTTTVYGTLFLGRQALAKAHSIVDGNGPVPHTVPGPVTDHLRRFVPWGWYWLGAYGIYRQAAILRVESASSQPFNQPTIDN
jgi:N4-gp56 family major capsid protein